MNIYHYSDGQTRWYVAPRLRICLGQCRSRHPSAASLARTQEHPAHGQVHRAEFGNSSGSSAIFAAIRRAYAIPNFFDTCAGSKRNVTVSRLVQCAPDGGRLRHVETPFKKQTSESSLTRVGFCRRVSLDGRRRVRLNQRSVGQYTADFTESESGNLSRRRGNLRR